MGSKLSLIISLAFSLIIFTFLTDLICIQVNYSMLDSLASDICLLISTKGKQSKAFITIRLKSYEDVSIKYDNSDYSIGTFKTFYLTKTYKSLYLNNLTLKIERSTVVGIYDKELN